MTEAVTQLEIDQRVFDLYDEYCHGRIDHRQFLLMAGAVAGGLAMAQALLPRYAQAQTISFTDTRIKAQYVTYPVGGYPGNDDDGRTLQANLDQGELRTDMFNSAKFLKAHKLSTGKLGVTGFGRHRQRAEDQGAAADPLRRVGPTNQRNVARVRDRAESRRRGVPGAHLPGHPARLSQQFDAALPGSSGDTGVGTHRGLLQDKPGLIVRGTFNPLDGPDRGRRGGEPIR